MVNRKFPNQYTKAWVNSAMYWLLCKKNGRLMASYIMAGATRLELAAFCVTGRRSNQTELRPQRVKHCIVIDHFYKQPYSVKIKLCTRQPTKT